MATFGEFNWAVLEANSFGYSKYLRERVYGEYTSGAAHYAGMGAGIGISLVLGYGAAKTAGWTAKALGAYVIAGDVIGVTESSYHLAKGDFQPLHALGFVPMVGWGLGSARRFGGFTKEILIDASAGYHVAPSFVPVVIPVMPMLPMVHPAITAASVGLVVGDQVYTAWRYGRTARQLAERADELLLEYIRHRYADFKRAGSLRELGTAAGKHVEKELVDYAENVLGLKTTGTQKRIPKQGAMESYRVADFKWGKANLIIEITLTPIELTDAGLTRLSLGSSRKYNQIVDMVYSGNRVMIVGPNPDILAGM